MDESKAILAKDIVEDSAQIPAIMSEYILLKDSALSGTFSNLIVAINILADYGWHPISTTMDASSTIYALIHNTNYKRKND